MPNNLFATPANLSVNSKSVSGSISSVFNDIDTYLFPSTAQSLFKKDPNGINSSTYPFIDMTDITATSILTNIDILTTYLNTPSSNYYTALNLIYVAPTSITSNNYLITSYSNPSTAFYYGLDATYLTSITDSIFKGNTINMTTSSNIVSGESAGGTVRGGVFVSNILLGDANSLCANPAAYQCGLNISGGIKNTIFDTNTIDVQNSIWGGGLIGDITSKKNSNIGDITNSIFNANKITTTKYGLKGGGLIGFDFGTGGNSYDGNGTTSIVTANIGDINNSIFSNNEIKILATQDQYQEDGGRRLLGGGGLIGASSAGGTFDIGDIKYTSFFNNTISGNVSGGGLIGLYMLHGYDYNGGLSIANISNSIFYKNTITSRDLSGKIGVIMGGGLIGMTQRDPNGDFNFFSINKIENSIFNNNEITQKQTTAGGGGYYDNDIGGGPIGIIGGGILGVKGDNVIFKILNGIHNSQFSHNEVSAERFIEGGGIIGGHSYFSSCGTPCEVNINGIYDSHFDNNTITNIVEGGGIIGSRGQNLIFNEIKNTTFNDNTVTGGTIITSYETGMHGGGILGVNDIGNNAFQLDLIQNSKFENNTITMKVGDDEDDNDMPLNGLYNVIDDFGGIIFAPSLMNGITIQNTSFKDNTITTTNTNEYTGTIVLVNTGTNYNNNVILKANAGEKTEFKNNKFIRGAETYYNSFLFNPINPQVNKVSLTINANGTGEVILADPIYVSFCQYENSWGDDTYDCNNPNNAKFNMEVNGTGNFYWGGENVILNNYGATDYNIDLKANSNTYFLDGFSLLYERKTLVRETDIDNLITDPLNILSINNIKGNIFFDRKESNRITGSTSTAPLHIMAKMDFDAGSSLNFYIPSNIANGGQIVVFDDWSIAPSCSSYCYDYVDVSAINITNAEIKLYIDPSADLTNIANVNNYINLITVKGNADATYNLGADGVQGTIFNTEVTAVQGLTKTYTFGITKENESDYDASVFNTSDTNNGHLVAYFKGAINCTTIAHSDPDFTYLNCPTQWCVANPTSAICTSIPTNLNPKTKSLSKGKLSSLILTSKTSDILWDIDFNRVQTPNVLFPEPIITFANMEVGDYNYDNKTLKMSDKQIVVGAALKEPYNNKNLLLGTFLELGLSNYKNHDDFENISSVNSSGNDSYLGIGVMGQYKYGENIFSSGGSNGELDTDQEDTGLSYYVGAIYERELRGNMSATTGGMNIAEPSIKGNTMMLEAGLTGRMQNWSVDGGIVGHFGVRNGIGGNLVARYNFGDAGNHTANYNYNSSGYFYTETSLHLGKVKTDYESSDYEFLGTAAKYDSKSNYATFHIGQGYSYNMDSNRNIKMYANYKYSNVSADNATLPTGEVINFKNAVSNRIRIGTRWTERITKSSPKINAYEDLFEYDGNDAILFGKLPEKEREEQIQIKLLSLVKDSKGVDIIDIKKVKNITKIDDNLSIEEHDAVTFMNTTFKMDKFAFGGAELTDTHRGYATYIFHNYICPLKHYEICDLYESPFLDKARVEKEIAKNKEKGYNDFTIVLTGHTDVIGGSEMNIKLGLKRAQAVKAELVRIGIPADKIVFASFGKIYPIFGKTSSLRELDRRVDVWIRKKR